MSAAGIILKMPPAGLMEMGPVFLGCFAARRRRESKMIVVIKNGAPNEKIENLVNEIQSKGLQVNVSVGSSTTVLGLIGDTTSISADALSANEIVETVKRVQEPYKKVNRKFHPDDTTVRVGSRSFGGNKIPVIAGPCSVESEAQICEVARCVKAAGATFLRGGAFKPRTSPYAFQGLRAEGLELLRIARQETGLPIVTEIMDPRFIEDFQDVDVIQVGARNMQNFELLKELGKLDKPILLKRGLSSTIQEFLMSAEYILAGGNNNVILCERGIRTYETYTRNTLDISAVPVLKHLTHLPVIVDPSHAAGITWLVEPLSKAAISAGADGLIIEVHNNPAKALSDGAQSLTPAQFDDVMKKLKKTAEVEGRAI